MDGTVILRRFNRAYTQRIGVLDESYLGTGRALGPSRVLFEVGFEGATVADLRVRLGLDSGYLSRLLRQLEANGLITLERHATDGRKRVVRLTAKGQQVWRQLDERSEEVAARLIAPLSPRQQEELASALATAERLLRAATVRFDVVDPGGPAARWAVGRYFAELDERFPTGFDPGEWPTPADSEALMPPLGVFVVLANDDQVVGCGGVQHIDDETGEIKRMWIDPDWRGLGLGARLLRELEARAVELGRSRVVLDTNGTLTEAIALYRRLGYEPIDRYNDNPYAQHWFAKHLT